jgi:hypothetical protein
MVESFQLHVHPLTLKSHLARETSYFIEIFLFQTFEFLGVKRKEKKRKEAYSTSGVQI